MSPIIIRLHRYTRAMARDQRPATRTSLFLSLALVLIISGMLIQPQRACADDYVPGTTLYLMENQGASDVTFTYSSQDGTVISATGNYVAVTLDYTTGHLYDRHGNIVGYIF